jgi:hypothetical protein
MATVAQVKRAILKVAGNPESGPIAQLADEMAKAVVALDEETPTREKRVVSPTETR